MAVALNITGETRTKNLRTFSGPYRRVVAAYARTFALRANLLEILEPSRTGWTLGATMALATKLEHPTTMPERARRIVDMIALMEILIGSVWFLSR